MMTKAPCSARLIEIKETIRPCPVTSLETNAAHAPERPKSHANKATGHHGPRARQEPGRQGDVINYEPCVAMPTMRQGTKVSHSPWCLGNAMTWTIWFIHVPGMPWFMADLSSMAPVRPSQTRCHATFIANVSRSTSNPFGTAALDRKAAQAHDAPWFPCDGTTQASEVSSWSRHRGGAGAWRVAAADSVTGLRRLDSPRGEAVLISRIT
jgi:hypothetical protein